jgi:hypothetical protein
MSWLYPREGYYPETINNALKAWKDFAIFSDYEVSNPKTYLVAVPLVSYLMQATTFEHARRLSGIQKNGVGGEYRTKGSLLNSQVYKSCSRAAKWYTVGALVHTIATALLIKTCPLLFIPLTLIGAVQILQSLAPYFPHKKAYQLGGNTYWTI